MAIEKTTELYEVLFRFDGGLLKGAHTKHLETVRDTGSGEVFTSRETMAAPLAAEDMAGIMDAALAGAAAQITTLTAARDALQGAVEALTLENNTLKKEG